MISTAKAIQSKLWEALANQFNEQFQRRGFVENYRQEGKWITIGGHAEGGKQHSGGTPVQVDGQGNILKGPPALEGRALDDLDGDSQDKPPTDVEIGKLNSEISTKGQQQDV